MRARRPSDAPDRLLRIPRDSRLASGRPHGRRRHGRHHTEGSSTTMGLIRTAAFVLGAVYLVVGALGFIPAAVFGDAHASMPSASGNLLGIFPINALHNVVHLAIGAALVYGATATAAAILVSR